MIPGWYVFDVPNSLVLNTVLGNVCFTVPVTMHRTVMDFAVSIVDSGWELHPNPALYLHAIPQNHEMSLPTLFNIQFGVQFCVDRVRHNVK